MASNGIELLTTLAKSRELSETDLPKIYQRLIDDGGLDTESLTVDGIVRGLNRDPNAPWHELYFGACELLAYYIVIGKSELQTIDCLSRCVAIMLTSIGIPSGYGSGIELANICRLLHLMGDAMYEDLDVMFCFVADQLSHPPPVRW